MEGAFHLEDKNQGERFREFSTVDTQGTAIFSLIVFDN